ncbi:MAG: OmpA family protein [Burkholderiales bacterium]
MRHEQTLIAIAVAVLMGGGCATEQQTQTAIGTGAGAATGAVVGGAVGGGRGAAVGAVVGAGVGAAVGYNWPKVKEKLGIATKDTSLDMAEQRDGAVKITVPGSVSFTSGSAVLSQQVYPALNKIAATLTEHPETTVNVVGHSDSAGSAAANLELARRRAQAVANYLAERGVARNRLMVDSKGELEPVADNSTESGRTQNRRVELLIRDVGS